MSVFARKMIGLFQKQLIPAVTVAIFMVPFAANAELLLHLHDTWGTSSVAEISRKSVKKPESICINENGDLVIRHSDVLLTVGYTPSNGVIEHQERLKIAQRLDCPSISGVSLKFSLQF